MRCLLAVLLVLLGPVTAGSQTPLPPPRDNTSPRTPAASVAGTGRILGRVVSADTGDALRNARVLLSPAPDSATPVMTDGDGRFSFGSLSAGTYTVLAAKTGFAPSAVAGAASKRPVSVVVRDGAEVRDVIVPLARGAVLSGRVADDLGEPVNNMTVFIEQLVE